MKVNSRQLSIIIFFLLISSKFLALPSLVYELCKADSWIVFVLIVLFDILLLSLILSFLFSAKEKSFFEFLKNRFGIVLAKIFCGAFLVVFLIDLFTGITGIQRMLVENFYNEFDWYIYLIPLLSIIAYMAYKGIRNIGRMCEIFAYLIVIGVIFVLIKAVAQFEPTFFLPIMTNGARPIFEAFFKHISWFGTPVALLFVMGDVDKTHFKKSSVIKWTALSSVLILGLVAIFFGVFKTSAGFHSFAISDLSQVSDFSTALDELSWLVICIWISGQILQLAIGFYVSVVALKNLSGIKNSWLPILILNIILILYQVLSNETVNIEKFLYSTPTAIIEWSVKVGLIILIAFANIFYLKRRRKNEKT